MSQLVLTKHQILVNNLQGNVQHLKLRINNQILKVKGLTGDTCFCRISDLCKDYCGVLDEEAIKCNFPLIYELLDEVLVSCIFLSLLIVIKKEFLLTIIPHFLTERYWERRKILLMEYRLIKHQILRAKIVHSFLPDTFVSRHFYLQKIFKFPFLLSSLTLYLHISVSGHSIVSCRGHFFK